jgi:hypothetical protein
MSRNKEDIANNLLQRLKTFEADSGKNKKKVQEHRDNIGEAKNFGVLTDDEISLVLAYRANQIRLDQNKKQEDVANIGGMGNHATYASFERTGKATLSSFIKVLRGLGRLKELESLLLRDVSAKIAEIELGGLKKMRCRARDR